MSESTQTQEQKPQTSAPAMAEAGFSMNVKMLDREGQEVQLTFRCALASQSAKLISHYQQTVTGLLDDGWQPSKPGAKASGNGGGVPTCPIHGTPMKESRKPGSYFCSKKADTDSGYCDQKAGGRN